MKKSRARINQEVADKLNNMELSERARDVINSTGMEVMAEVFGGLETSEQVERFIEEECGTQEAYELAQKIKQADEWNPEDCEALCEMAGLEDEWKAADGDNFEQVIYKAADILHVDIF